jgi:hypothetical protein
MAGEIFEQLVEINTTDSIGDNTEAAEAMARAPSGTPVFPEGTSGPRASSPEGKLVARSGEAASASDPCSSPTSTWSRRFRQIGRSTPSPSSSRTAFSTAAALGRQSDGRDLDCQSDSHEAPGLRSRS